MMAMRLVLRWGEGVDLDGDDDNLVKVLPPELGEHYSHPGSLSCKAVDDGDGDVAALRASDARLDLGSEGTLVAWCPGGLGEVTERKGRVSWLERQSRERGAAESWDARGSS